MAPTSSPKSEWKTVFAIIIFSLCAGYLIPLHVHECKMSKMHDLSHSKNDIKSVSTTSKCNFLDHVSRI